MLVTQGNNGSNKSLSNQLAKHAIRPHGNHPHNGWQNQSDVDQTTPTLEAWFDAGLVTEEHSAKFDTGQHLRGKLPLPKSYVGCDDHSILIEAGGSDSVKIWPIRFSLGDETAASIRPWTLYHYTHRASFNAFVDIFSQRSEDLSGDPGAEDGASYAMADIRKKLLHQLSEDYLERSPTASIQNPKSEPELMLLEPTKFKTKAEILQNLFGKFTVEGFSNEGVSFATFADFCLAFRVPQSACINLRGTTSDKSTNSKRQEAMVRICRDKLAAVTARFASQQAMLAKARKERHNKSSTSHSRMSWLGALCSGTKGKEAPEYWDDVGEKTEEQDQESKKRELTSFKKKLVTEWMKEFSVGVEVRKQRTRELALETGEGGDCTVSLEPELVKEVHTKANAKLKARSSTFRGWADQR
eukprot:TRINITY_DN23321_c0_g1_i1.p1 TRINITY_DN23321_c0_g1~~TRINITY_DN23321_c0_g1_i1.p1  ORF type:complete len:413 (+),score=59.63 TRINITY_DN23321_c0_g1_i1:153-1391(+)